jgi:hypothetical protein
MNRVGRFENPVLDLLAWIVLSPFILVVLVLGSAVLWSTGRRWFEEQ